MEETCRGMGTLSKIPHHRQQREWQALPLAPGVCYRGAPAGQMLARGLSTTAKWARWPVTSRPKVNCREPPGNALVWASRIPLRGKEGPASDAMLPLVIRYAPAAPRGAGMGLPRRNP